VRFSGSAAEIVVISPDGLCLHLAKDSRELSNHARRPAIVICSAECDPDIIEAAREAGALGYVFKARIRKDLVAAVKSVVRGQSFVSPA
jgi:DNA-binding NarL/FixJ family response regulator